MVHRNVSASVKRMLLMCWPPQTHVANVLASVNTYVVNVSMSMNTYVVNADVLTVTSFCVCV